MSATYSDRITGIETSTALKAPVVAATTANITLSGLQTIDGVALAEGDRVLVKDQTVGTENGVWTASANAWARGTDFNGARDVIEGTLIHVLFGDTNASQLFVLLTPSPVIGTSDITFTVMLSARNQYDTLAELIEDTRTFTAGTTLQVNYGGATLQAVASGGTVANAGTQQFVVITGPTFAAQTTATEAEASLYPSGTLVRLGRLQYLSDGAGNLTRIYPNPEIEVKTPPSGFETYGIQPSICTAIGRAQADNTVSAYALATYSGLIGGGVAWVDPVHGIDGGGGTESAPYKTLNYALRTASPSRVFCLPGVYSKSDFRNTDTPGNKLKIVQAMGECIIREDHDDPAAAVWTPDVTYVNVWKMSLTPANKDILAVLDHSIVDSEGQPRSLCRYTSTALLNTNALGSGYFHDTATDTLYIRKGRVESIGTITGATATNPVVLTVTAHTFVVGDKINVLSVGGMTELNGNAYLISAITANTITLANFDGTPLDGSGFTAYTSGGQANARDFNFFKKHDLELVTGDASSRLLLYGTKILFKGDWKFKGVYPAPYAIGSARTELFMEIPKTAVGPTISYTISHGLDAQGADTMLENVWVHRCKGDNFHYADAGAEVCQAIEIDCISTFAGDKEGEPTADNTHNASSMHGGGSVMRINGVFKYSWGPNVVDTGTGESWNIGSSAIGGDEVRGAFSGNDYGFYTTGPVMHLDMCSAQGHGQFDIATTTGGVIFDFAVASDTQSGTITAYNPAEL